MKKELREKLEKELEKQGLSKELSSLISISKESEIEGAVATLKKLQGNEEKSLDDYLNENSEAKSEIDRRITKAIETFKKKNNIKDDPKNDPNEDDDDDTPVWAKKMFDKIEKLEGEKAKDTKTSKAKELWNESKVLPDSLKKKWFNRIDVESDTSFEDQIKELETEFTETKQEFINSGASENDLPDGGDAKEVSDEVSDAIVEGLF